jgi:hypothetical protein
MSGVEHDGKSSDLVGFNILLFGAPEPELLCANALFV